jgi:hypothetical protein
MREILVTTKKGEVLGELLERDKERYRGTDGDALMLIVVVPIIVPQKSLYTNGQK